MRRTSLFLAVAVLSATVWAQDAYIPDHHRTPGAINPDITQQNINTTVCIPGYTKTIRPPSSYTSRLKAKQMRELGLPGTVHDYTRITWCRCAWGAPERPAQLVAAAGDREVEYWGEGPVGV